MIGGSLLTKIFQKRVEVIKRRNKDGTSSYQSAFSYSSLLIFIRANDAQCPNAFPIKTEVLCIGLEMCLGTVKQVADRSKIGGFFLELFLIIELLRLLLLVGFEQNKDNYL